MQARLSFKITNKSQMNVQPQKSITLLKKDSPYIPQMILKQPFNQKDFLQFNKEHRKKENKTKDYQQSVLVSMYIKSISNFMIFDGLRFQQTSAQKEKQQSSKIQQGNSSYNSELSTGQKQSSKTKKIKQTQNKPKQSNITGARNNAQSIMYKIMNQLKKICKEKCYQIVLQNIYNIENPKKDQKKASEYRSEFDTRSHNRNDYIDHLQKNYQVQSDKNQSSKDESSRENAKSGKMPMIECLNGKFLLSKKKFTQYNMVLFLKNFNDIFRIKEDPSLAQNQIDEINKQMKQFQLFITKPQKLMNLFNQQSHAFLLKRILEIRSVIYLIALVKLGPSYQQQFKKKYLSKHTLEQNSENIPDKQGKLQQIIKQYKAKLEELQAKKVQIYVKKSIFQQFLCNQQSSSINSCLDLQDFSLNGNIYEPRKKASRIKNGQGKSKKIKKDKKSNQLKGIRKDDQYDNQFHKDFPSMNYSSNFPKKNTDNENENLNQQSQIFIEQEKVSYQNEQNYFIEEQKNEILMDGIQENSNNLMDLVNEEFNSQWSNTFSFKFGAVVIDSTSSGIKNEQFRQAQINKYLFKELSMSEQFIKLGNLLRDQQVNEQSCMYEHKFFSQNHDLQSERVSEQDHSTSCIRCLLGIKSNNND